MTDVLVTGATGFLGAALMAHFRRADAPVTGTSRCPRQGLIAVGEIDAATDWRPALKPGQAVIHCAGLAHTNAQPADYQRVNVAGTLNLARQAAEAGVTRFVFISSIHVNGTKTVGQPFTAKDRPHPRKPYAVSKLRAEDGLKLLSEETGLEVVIIRPPLIVGPGGKGNVALLAKLVRLGLPTPFGLPRNRRDVVSLSVLCRLVETCMTTPVAGQTILASDGAPLSTRDLIDRVAGDHGLRKPVHLPVPVWLLGALMPGGLRSQLLGDLEIGSQ